MRIVLRSLQCITTRPKFLPAICRRRLNISIRKITQVYKQIESAAELHLINLLPQELQQEFAPYLDSQQFSPEEKHVVKQADLICAYIKTKFELEHGNQEFTQAKRRLEQLLDTWKSPEMDYFMQVFVPSFAQTLDEIAF